MDDSSTLVDAEEADVDSGEEDVLSGLFEAFELFDKFWGKIVTAEQPEVSMICVLMENITGSVIAAERVAGVLANTSGSGYAS